MAATLRGKLNIVKYLLESGADASIGERDGFTPPHGAAFQGRPDVMGALIAAGLDVNSYHEKDGFLPLHRTCWGREKVRLPTSVTIYNYFLSHNDRFVSYCSYCFLIIKPKFVLFLFFPRYHLIKRHAETLRVLLDHGIPHDIESKDGLTCAKMTQNVEIKKVLEEVTGLDSKDNHLLQNDDENNADVDDNDNDNDNDEYNNDDDDDDDPNDKNDWVMDDDDGNWDDDDNDDDDENWDDDDDDKYDDNNKENQRDEL